MKTINLILFLSLILNQVHAQMPGELSVIPRPTSIKRLSDGFLISAKSKIYTDIDNPELEKIASLFSEQLSLQNKLTIARGTRLNVPARNLIHLTLKNAPDTLGKEGYILSVQKNAVTVTAKTTNGIFYGLQSLLQLIPFNTGVQSNAALIPGVVIVDKPRFEWRGLMLDVGRYFYSVDFIKKYIDYMAMHKLNTFHWHLTEDHGWRIEIKKYPRLTEIGAWREGTQFNRAATQINNTPHGGYYTQDQIREVVAYAKERYVTVIPEIEMPGHSLAALVAYPELSCSGGPFKIPANWGIQKDVLCAGNEQTFKFLEDVLTEVAELFPSPIIHIGGDECPKDRWKICRKCQGRMKNEGLKDEHELQSYFIKRIENFLLTKRKNIIGWDEILEGGLAPNAAVMSWRGITGGVAAARQGHNVVMSPTEYMYFDYYQGAPYLEPLAVGSIVSLDKVYSFEPVPTTLTKEEAKYIKGVQGNIWSEFIHSPDKVEYMTYPRAAALAEVAWTDPAMKSWNDFKRRMNVQYKRYSVLGINYARSAMNVSYSLIRHVESGTALVTLKTDSFEPDIRYTIDGTEPGYDSPKYTAPFQVRLPGTIKAAVFDENKKQYKVSVFSVLK